MKNNLQKAIRLRASGLSYQRIGDQLGISRWRVICLLEPDYAEKEKTRARARSATRRSDPKHRQRHAEYVRMRRKSLYGRCKSAITDTAFRARKFGYAACDVTVERLMAMFTGECHLCHRPESDCDKRLALDHCHHTGRFRGWLCNDCNVLLGYAKDSVQTLKAAIKYLNPRLK